MIDSNDDAPPAAAEGAPAWMATFADLMSLLLTFFILILSFANMDVIKFSAAVESLQEAFGTTDATRRQDTAVIPSVIALEAAPRPHVVALSQGSGATEMDPLRREIDVMIRRHHLEKLVEVEENERVIIVRVVGQLLFDPGSVTLRPESFVLLNELAGLVRAVPEPLSIEGHSDDTASATSTAGSNWHLSAGRAISVLEYLVSVHGVDPARLSITGYGSTRPLVPNDSPENRETNRRVEFVFPKTRPAEARTAAAR